MNRLVGFLTYEQIHASPNSGSSRVRARMLTKHWPESEVFKIGRKYSAVIFQNSHWCEYARRFGGAKILDVSDPNLLWNPEFLAMTDLCDAVSTPTSALADFVAQYTETPTFCVQMESTLIAFVRFVKHIVAMDPPKKRHGSETA
jgi:hypothetical protein